jgi:hypothetical protein
MIPLCDGIKTSKEIAEILGWRTKYVQKMMLKLDLPRLPQAPRCGKHNPSFLSGRKIDKLGYVLVCAPLNHPRKRLRPRRTHGTIFEHRLVMEKVLGRYLEPKEVIDHIDGIRLNNHPDNLKLYSCNADHLRETLAGKCPNWSEQGYQSMTARHHGLKSQQVDIFRLRKATGDIRLQQICRAWLSLQIDSPYLYGTKHWLEKAGIDWSDRSKIEQALVELTQKWESTHAVF